MNTARRLASLKATAAGRVATILRCHPDAPYRAAMVEKASDWRNARTGTAQPSAGWSDDGKAYYPMSFAGFRFIGTAHDVTRRDGYVRNAVPTGWYVDDMQSETMTGVVLQLPAREGVARYVPALQWSDRDGVTVYPCETYPEALEAARAADHYAERQSEEERDYSEAWQAGSRWASIADDIATARKEALALLVERRRVTLPPVMCATIRGRVAALLTSITEYRETRAELVEQYSGLDSWRSQLTAAFNDGAGETVAA